MIDIHGLIKGNDLMDSPSIHFAFILIMLGLWIKMAFFPLHGWLPNVYSKCSFHASSLIAPLMTKVTLYVMARMMITVFGTEYILEHLPWREIIVWVSATGIIAASIMALSQRKFRRMLTYIVVAEVGYIVGGIWLFEYTGVVGALYHIISDTLMTVCLFLAAAAIYQKIRNEQLSSFNKLFSKMPLTMGAFVIGALSMLGVPPTCGFFSKWYLISGGVAAGQWFYVVAIIFSSLVNAILFFRLFEYAFFGVDIEKSDHHEGEDMVISEASPTLLIPLCISAISLPLVGIYNADIVNFISKALPTLATFQ